MPLFAICDSSLAPIRQTNFDKEKRLQNLVEVSLQPVFNCRLVASEFSTGSRHGGRTDSLALSEDNNPVIIEYKKVESSELINQSLFYLSWIHDHRGDFHLAAQKALGNDIEVDWSDIRVICIAPNYRKFDLHAVGAMGAKIELWTYRLFENDTVYFEEVFRKSISVSSDDGKDPKMIGAGKKSAETRQTGSYTYEEHIKDKPPGTVELAEAVREFVLSLDPAMEESPKKFYVAYKISQNILCMEVQRKKLLLYVKLDPTVVDPFPAFARDVRKIGHYGTGDLELSIPDSGAFETCKPLIELAYQSVGG